MSSSTPAPPFLSAETRPPNVNSSWKTRFTPRLSWLKIADMRLVSPFDGLVVKRNRDPGEVVVPGSAVLDLVATREIWVSAWVDETAMAGLAAGQPARIVFRPAAIGPWSLRPSPRGTEKHSRRFARAVNG